MLKVEFGLLPDCSIGVEGRLDTVSEHADVHGGGRMREWWCSVCICKLDTGGAVKAAVGSRPSALRQWCPPLALGMIGGIEGKKGKGRESALVRCAPCDWHPSCIWWGSRSK